VARYFRRPLLLHLIVIVYLNGAAAFHRSVRGV
jgi:hypothetical protein